MLSKVEFVVDFIYQLSISRISLHQEHLAPEDRSKITQLLRWYAICSSISTYRLSTPNHTYYPFTMCIN